MLVRPLHDAICIKHVEQLLLTLCSSMSNGSNHCVCNVGKRLQQIKHPETVTFSSRRHTVLESACVVTFSLVFFRNIFYIYDIAQSGVSAVFKELNNGISLIRKRCNRSVKKKQHFSSVFFVY